MVLWLAWLNLVGLPYRSLQLRGHSTLNMWKQNATPVLVVTYVVVRFVRLCTNWVSIRLPISRQSVVRREILGDRRTRDI